MKVIIAAGGTGGHIYPGIAIAKNIKAKAPQAQILFAGTNRGLEKDLVPKEGFDIELIRVKGFKRKLSLDTLVTVKEMFLGLHDARSIVKKFKPDVVIGTGGYVCGPVLFAAWQKKIPTLIHEQNAFPGITNRILSRFVTRVALSFPEAKKHFKDDKKIIISGNPIRSEFKERDRLKARKALNIPMNKKLIVVTGGSQGAHSINKSMIKVIKAFYHLEDVDIVHITGKNQYESVMENLKKENINIENSKNIQVTPYTYDMANLLKASNLIIARAGAMTVSEISAVGRACILVPYPYATDNHQEFNAKVITDNKGGFLILDKDLNGKLLINTIEGIIFDDNKIKSMEEKSYEQAILNGADILYNQIKDIISAN